jgi:two-component system NarL family response regulator
MSGAAEGSDAHAPAKIRILLADDHHVMRAGLAALIGMQPDMEVVGEAATGGEAVEQFVRCAPDVTLMDLRMPETDGVAAIEQIRAGKPGARIIVLTTYDGDVDIYRALHAGARGYLLKDTPHQQLLEAIRSVHAGGMHIPPDVSAKLAMYITQPALTEREMVVLQRMAAGESNQQIAAALSVAESTVKSHISSIFTKLNVGDRTEAVMTAGRRGLIRLE